MKKIYNFFLLLLIFFTTLCGCEINKDGLSFEVQNYYFTLEKYELNKESDDLGNDKCYLSIYANCAYKLKEVTVNTYLYNGSSNILATYESTIQKNIKTKETFIIDLEIDEYLYSIKSSIDIEFCGKSSDIPYRVYTVTFDYGLENEKNLKVEVQKGNTISKPEEKLNYYYVFDCWCTDEELKYEYDFSKKVKKDFTLYARYLKDVSEIVNKVRKTALKSTIGILSLTQLSSGSGVVFDSDNDYHYALTNNHVINVKENGIKTFNVKDYVGDIYSASLVCSNPNYDLAVLKFRKKKTLIPTIEFNEVGFNDKSYRVASIGHPEMEDNVITNGYVYGYYDAPKLEGTKDFQSNVNFSVLKHDAKIYAGSSGGPLIDFDMKLVGINYAGLYIKETGAFINGYAIPVEKVKEFLDLYYYN